MGRKVFNLKVGLSGTSFGPGVQLRTMAPLAKITLLVQRETQTLVSMMCISRQQLLLAQ